MHNCLYNFDYDSLVTLRLIVQKSVTKTLFNITVVCLFEISETHRDKSNGEYVFHLLIGRLSETSGIHLLRNSKKKPVRVSMIATKRLDRFEIKNLLTYFSLPSFGQGC